MVAIEQKADCLVCGCALVYDKRQVRRACFYCRMEKPGNARCKAGHFVCDRCHSLGGNDLIEKVCAMTEEEDPVKLAIRLMRSPAIKMHGPEHHFLVPAVLLATYCNAAGEKGEKGNRIREARKRAENVPGGFCGFYGDCGAAVGTGIFVSVATGATPLSRKEWRLANLMTAGSLLAIALHGGPRCCKRNTFLAIGEAVAFARRELGVKLPAGRRPACTFSRLNRECLGQECPFHRHTGKGR